MKEIGKVIKGNEEEYIYGVMEVVILEMQQMIKWKEKVYFIQRMEIDMKENL